MSGDTGTYTEASQFPDVPSGTYYYNAVGWGVANGIVTGAAEGYFYPYNTLTFQDLCVFMYRFAEYSKYPLTPLENISSLSDYSTISPYALTAVRWAYAYGIKAYSSSSDTISPKVSVPRKDLALYVTRYRHNVEGIKLGRDNFCFVNNYGEFVSGFEEKYCISQEDYDYLYDYAYHTSSTAISLLSEKKDLAWSGACYGMSLAVALDYCGKIDLNGNFATDCDTLYEIPSLWNPSFESSLIAHTTTDMHDSSTIISEVESKINMYQLSQFVFQWSVSKWSTCLTLDEGIGNLMDGLEHGGIGLFSFTFSDLSDAYGHTVVTFGKPSQAECDSTSCNYDYHVQFYDPNEYEYGLLHISKTSYGDTWTAFATSSDRTYYIDLCSFENDFDIADNIDIDSEDNVLSTPSASTDGVENAVLYIQATGDFTVTNAEGESFHFSGGEATGTMDVYGIDMIVYGKDVPCEYMFLIDRSNSYTCTADDGVELLSFYSVDNDACNGGIADDMDNWVAVTITSGETIEVEIKGGD